MNEDKKNIKLFLVTVLTILAAIATIVSTFFTQDEIQEYLGFKSEYISDIDGGDRTKSLLSTTIGAASSLPKMGPRVISEGKPIFWEDANTYLNIAFQILEGEEFLRVIISPVGMPTKKYAVLNGSEENFESSSGEYQLQVLTIDYLNKNASIFISSKL